MECKISIFGNVHEKRLPKGSAGVNTYRTLTHFFADPRNVTPSEALCGVVRAHLCRGATHGRWQHPIGGRKLGGSRVCFRVGSQRVRKAFAQDVCCKQHHLGKGARCAPPFHPPGRWPGFGIELTPGQCTDPPVQHGSVERSCSSDTAMTKETRSPWTHRKEYSRNAYPTARSLCRCELQIAAEGVRQLHLPGRFAFSLKNLG